MAAHRMMLLRRASLALLAHSRRPSVAPHRFLPLASPLPHNSLSARLFATRSTADSYLVEVLKSEIEHELHQEASKQGSLKGSAGPFELADKPGTEEIVLSRTFGNEQIAVTCLVESQYPDDEGADQEEEDHNEGEVEEGSLVVKQDKPVDCLHLNVNITKGAEVPALEIECTFYRGDNDIVIASVSYMTEASTDLSDKKPQPYEGPCFEDLDENLQRAFHDLLKARGLTPRVATYVMDYLTGKEHREYMRWLHNVETFFTS